MEREIYTVLENIDNAFSNGCKIYQVFTDHTKAESLAQKLNYERTKKLIVEQGITSVFTYYDYLFFEDEFIEGLIKQLRDKGLNLEELSFEQFLEMQQIVFEETQKVTFGYKMEFFEIKKIKQYLQG